MVMVGCKLCAQNINNFTRYRLQLRESEVKKWTCARHLPCRAAPRRAPRARSGRSPGRRECDMHMECDCESSAQVVSRLRLGPRACRSARLATHESCIMN